MIKGFTQQLALFAFIALPGIVAPALSGAQPRPSTETTKPAISAETAKPETAKPVVPVTLDSLFARLSKAADAYEAKGVSDQIERIWAKSGSDTVDLLMVRANRAIKVKQYDVALDLLDSILALEPGWAEGWNKRATVLFLQDDFDGSMRDIRQTLALEPRHYGAIVGIGMIYQKMEDPKRALKAARAALAINPFLAGAKSFVERYARQVEGDSL